VRAHALVCVMRCNATSRYDLDGHGSYNSEMAKLNKLRQLLAKKTQEAQLIKRKIDEIPTRTELVQYERRFVELYEQVAAKLEETRR